MKLNWVIRKFVCVNTLMFYCKTCLQTIFFSKKQQVSAGPKFPKDRSISDECKNLIQKILRPVNVRITIEEMRRQPWLTENDSGYDDMGIEKRYDKKMKLDNSSSDSSDGSTRVTINNPGCSASPGHRDDNHNLSPNGHNGTISQNVLNRKRSVPQWIWLLTFWQRQNLLYFFLFYYTKRDIRFLTNSET